MSLHPLVDFAQMSKEDLQEKQKEYTKKLYSISPTSPLYDAVLSMKMAIESEYHERMYLDSYKEGIENSQQVLDIGTISSDVHTPDYSDYKDQVTKSLVDFYTKKETENDQDS